MAEAATDLATIGETLNAAHLTAAPPTLAVLPAAADEVSASIAHLFSGYGEKYQKLAGQAAGFGKGLCSVCMRVRAGYASAAASWQNQLSAWWWNLVEAIIQLEKSSAFFAILIQTLIGLFILGVLFVGLIMSIL